MEEAGYEKLSLPLPFPPFLAHPAFQRTCETCRADSRRTRASPLQNSGHSATRDSSPVRASSVCVEAIHDPLAWFQQFLGDRATPAEGRSARRLATVP
jgi:hypothetical protein